MRQKYAELFKANLIKGIAFATGIGLTGLFAGTFENNMWVFSSGDTISAAQINSNFAVNRMPVGAIIAWHKSLSGLPALPDNWVECSGGTINDSDSPIHGEAIPDLNSDAGKGHGGRFLRGATTSGTFQTDMMFGHKHLDSGHNHTVSTTHSDGADVIGWVPGAFGVQDRNTTTESAVIGDAVASSYGAPNSGTETRPTNMNVVWIMKIK